MIRFVGGFVLALVLIVAGGLMYVYSGSFDVRAATPHDPVTGWLLRTTMENAVEANAKSVDEPPDATPEMVRAGLEHFDAMCVGCHGGPGIERSEIGKGLNPRPPDLDEAAGEMSSRQLFWVVKNGIKMSGMPSIGETHDDQTIWNIVAFVEKLHDMSPEQYRKMKEAKANSGGTAGHSDTGEGLSHDGGSAR